MLEIKSLGQMAINLKNATTGLRVDSRRSLLMIFLAETGRPQLRSELATFLWPRSERQQAQVSLRVLLNQMRAEGYAPYLQADRNTLALTNRDQVHYDMGELTALLNTLEQATPADLLAIEKLYQGPFCAGLPAEQFPELQEWSDAIQYSLEIRLAQAFERLSGYLLAQRKIAHALETSKHLVALAPYEERAQILYVSALAADNQILAARQHLAAYKALMREDFPNLPLNSEIERIAHLLNDPKRSHKLLGFLGQSQPAASVSVSLPEEPPQPQPITATIIGRDAEANWLQHLLNSGHRLISLVGMGGTGKTTFICSKLADLKSYAPDGVTFVDVRALGATINSDEDLLSTILHTRQMPQVNETPLFNQVIAALGPGRQVLVLDNFEEIHQCSNLVLQLFDALPYLTIIVTSRQRLSSGKEAVLVINGLPTAVNNDPATSPSQAARLFQETADKLYPQLINPGTDLPKIETLCRQLGGLPLAIELAAQKLAFYNLNELLQAITNDLTILENTAQDAPSHHRSLAAILVNTWQALPAEAQDVLMRLSVFSGRWHRLAMQAIAPAPHTTYQLLLNTTSIHMEKPGWFSMNPLLRQHAGKQMGQSEYQATMMRYSSYFLGLLPANHHLLDMVAARDSADTENALEYYTDIAAAWRWAVNHDLWSSLHSSISGLVDYLWHKPAWQEGADLLQLLTDRLPSRLLLPGQLFTAGMSSFGRGMLLAQQGDSPAHLQARRQGLTLLKRADDPWHIAAAHICHAEILLKHNSLTAEAAASLHIAAEIAVQHGFFVLQTRIDTLNPTIHG